MSFKKISPVLIIAHLICSCIVFSQQSWNEGEVKLLNSHQIKSQLDSGLYSSSKAAYAYNDIGNYEAALNSYNLQWAFGWDSCSREEANAFHEYKPVNAFDYFEETPIESDIVIISESHTHPQHRIFTHKLLPILKAQGFTHLGLECLANHWADSTLFLADTELNERGYPLNKLISGRYARQAEMANLIREAHRLGFTLFSHERREKGEERDFQQAKEVMRYRRLHGNPKIILHVGWYHALESKTIKRHGPTFYLAGNLKHLYGIDPLTIYQDILSEKKTEPESPYFKMINSVEISVLVNEEGQLFEANRKTHHLDIQIYHPRTTYQYGRPQWRYLIPNVVPVDFDRAFLEDANYPVIIGAKKMDEHINTSPCDVIELENMYEEKVLVLEPGKYILYAIDADGNRYISEL